MIFLRHKAFRLGVGSRWSWRHGMHGSPADLEEIRRRAEDFANAEVGAEHVVSVVETHWPRLFTVTVWYRHEARKPAKVGVPDDDFAGSILDHARS